MEIYQNCPIFNDGAFDTLKGADGGFIPLTHGQPITFGADGARGVVRDAAGHLKIADVAEVGLENVLVHDAHADDPGLAFALSRLTDTETLNTSPIGIFRDVQRPTYDDLARAQLTTQDDPAERLDKLQQLITGSDTWTV